MARALAAAAAILLTIVFGAAPSQAQKVYITNQGSNSVSVIDVASHAVTATIPVGALPRGVAVAPDSSTVYVTNNGDGTVSVIDTVSNTVSATVDVGESPNGVAVTPDGSKVYVANTASNDVSVIDTGSGTVIATVSGIALAYGVAVDADGSGVFVTSSDDPGNVYVIATENNTIVDTIPVGPGPEGIAFSPDGSTAYVTNTGGNTVSVIDAASDAVTGTVKVGKGPTGVVVKSDGIVVYVANSKDGTLSLFETNPPFGSVATGSDPSGLSMTPDGQNLYVANTGSNTVSMFSTNSDSTIALIATIPVGSSPVALGKFIGSPPPTEPTLTVAKTGTGVGTVTSAPPGIDCPGTCESTFKTGTQITLTASAVSGSTFSGWSGGRCSGTDDCVLALNASTTVTANFDTDVIANLTLVAAVLPLSRSVEVGKTATAFATIIDTGPADAESCSIAPATSVPASFVYQTTNPATNALTGTANTPANIAAGQSQSFVIGLTPTAAFPPTNLSFTFNCANSPAPAMTTVGVDTLNLSASATPVPDVVALAASSDPGYVDIPGATGTGDFAVATVNLGSDATITAAANTGGITLPVTLALCQTNPASGACLAAPAATVTTDIAPNATPTFGVFVTGAGTVADMPGTNRVFVTFTDSGGTLRGETSVALRTQ